MRYPCFPVNEQIVLHFTRLLVFHIVLSWSIMGGLYAKFKLRKLKISNQRNRAYTTWAEKTSVIKLLARLIPVSVNVCFMFFFYFFFLNLHVEKCYSLTTLMKITGRELTCGEINRCWHCLKSKPSCTDEKTIFKGFFSAKPCLFMCCSLLVLFLISASLKMKPKHNTTQLQWRWRRGNG